MINYHLPKFSSHRNSGRKDIIFLIYYVISYESLVKRLLEFIGGTSECLVAIGLAEVMI